MGEILLDHQQEWISYSFPMVSPLIHQINGSNQIPQQNSSENGAATDGLIQPQPIRRSQMRQDRWGADPRAHLSMMGPVKETLGNPRKMWGYWDL